eukprot:CAMPEP_0202481756 /NCGR_PEP_ID=MMETSP1361-20130828/1244_1 /ASSEMBLY_ACC=CAM_ASM_000849 /TAXON_ID=210615 /ORGANISM="Staurosira complex sp., Strain CCMP2646" /LENGTH=157 /DNA_ID=CAMNT_0049109345 /DNA_START=124 /DNA_END=597 /DNA_ORIENTATION=+
MPLAKEDYADSEDNDLFRAIKNCDWTEAQALLRTEEGKQMANEQDSFSNTPLHAALGYKAPDEFIIDLLNTNKKAITIHATGNEWLPLHVAAMYGSSAKVMELIIRAYPQALDDPGEGGIKGRTPRHFSQRFPHNRELLDRSTDEWVAIVKADKEMH